MAVVPLANPVLSQTAFRPDFPIFCGGTFPEKAWDPALKSQLVMAEFGASGWTAIRLPAPDLTPETLAAEIDELLNKAYLLRGARMAEIVKQANDLTLYFASLMHISAGSHPATWQLVSIAMNAGHMASMYFKHQFQRARPVQVYPTLMPGIMTPAHPSYPNGHAVQSNLIALCLMAATSPAAKAAPVHYAPEQSPYRDGLINLADRIGENREIAGLHFPSDAKASRLLAPQLLHYLWKGPIFRDVVAAAAQEWPAQVTAVPHRFTRSTRV